MAPHGSHHAFEALPHLAKSLCEEFPGVQIHSAAVSDRIGRAEFQFVRNDPAYSGLRRRIYDRPDPDVTSIVVATTTLDASIPPDQDITFIKIDIEGGEYHALKGAESTIRRTRPVIVFEAGAASTGQYGVTAGDLYELICTIFHYDLSTMKRWLNRLPSYTQLEFEHTWTNGLDYYFIATPHV